MAFPLKLATLALTTLVAVASPDEHYWVTEQDTQAAADAYTARAEYCKEDSRGDIDREAGREALLANLGGRNVIQEILVESQSSADFATKAASKMSATWLVRHSWPMCLALFLCLLWLGCCWSCCPCCSCCRCGAKYRQTGCMLKIIVFVAGVVLMLMNLFLALVAFGGYNETKAGLDSVACTAAEMLNSTLGGQSEPYFIGMIPLLNTFKELDDQLLSTSTMMTQVRSLVNSTQTITDSVTIASETLKALEDALTSLPVEIGDNHHSCEFCSELAPVLARTVTELQGGIGAALSSAREQVEKQLSPEKSAELQDVLRNSAKPLSQVKDFVRTALRPFANDENYNSFKAFQNGPMFFILGLIFLLTLCLMVCMCSSLLSCFICERTSTASETGKKPVNCFSYHCACCSWCCGFFFAILALGVGGLLSAFNVPLSSVCLTMEDLNSKMLTDIGSGIGLNLTGDTGDIVKDMIDQCFVPPPGVNAKLLDIIFIRDNESAPKVTLREKIVDNTKDMISEQFQQVSSLLSRPGMTMANNSAIMSLIAILANPVDIMILPDQNYAWETDANYMALFADGGLRAFFGSSVNCSNGTVSLLGNQTTIPGVQEFENRLADFGPLETTRTDCANTVTCTDPVNMFACDAGNAYMKLKQNIRDATTFKCHVFVNPSDGVSDCDPIDMVRTNGGWSNGCIDSDGTMTRRTKNCSLPEFVTYMANFGTRIQTATERIDDIVKLKGDEINQGLRKVVDVHIIHPIERVANGVTCGFIGVAYDNLISGLCYQGVLGFDRIATSYVYCGVLSIFLIIMMYGVWRRGVDNANAAARSLCMASTPADISRDHYEDKIER